MKFGSARHGQVALIVALVVVVGLTIAVSVASRSVTTVSVSTGEEEHARAFSAAEAGIEEAFRTSTLTTGTTLPVDAATDTTASYSFTQVADTASATVDPGEVVTVDWTATGVAATSFSVAWSGVTGCAVTPKLLSAVLTSAGAVTQNVSTSSPQTFTKGASDRLVRLRFIGCRASATLTATATLPFYQVDSLGTSGESQSRVVALRSAPAAVGIMDYAVFSGGGIQ